MKKQSLVFLTQLACCALAFAADALQPRKGTLTAAGLFVPVSVDGCANDDARATFAEIYEKDLVLTCEAPENGFVAP